MTSRRLEAFSDAVIAIVMTVMVLALRRPSGSSWTALRHEVPSLSMYVLSFAILAIYWNNHHHLLFAIERVNGNILWANMHLLFWLSLVPFITDWTGGSRFAPLPVAAYGVVLFCAGAAYYILVRAILAEHGAESLIARAIGSDVKGRISVVAYAIGIVLAYPARWASLAVYVAVALMWLIPDRRIERALSG
ncbi:MAG: TMEM175 family protein [Actinomycetota bacterium]